jgi:hypothetical protein
MHEFAIINVLKMVNHSLHIVAIALDTLKESQVILRLILTSPTSINLNRMLKLMLTKPKVNLTRILLSMT